MSSPVWHYTTSVRARRHVNANIITSIPSSPPNLSTKWGKYISDVLWACIRPAFFDIKDFLPSHTLTLMQSQLHLILSNALILPCSPFDEACRCWQVCEENSENAGIWIALSLSLRHFASLNVMSHNLQYVLRDCIKRMEKWKLATGRTFHAE